MPEQELVRRLGARMVCRACGVNATPESAAAGRCGRCGGELVQRADDDAEVVRERLQVFTRDTQPLVEFYRSRSMHQRGGRRRRRPTQVFADLAAVAEAGR